MGLSQRLQEILDELNLTPFGAAHLIGAETDESIKAINTRLRQCLAREPKAWQEVDSMLKALGYEIRIVKKGDRDE